MSSFGRMAAIAPVAFATAGSTVFGGAALAVDKKDGHEVATTGGAVGSDGYTTYYNCAVVVETSTGNADGNAGVLLTCTATADGGHGGTVAVY
jgi:hypothetical protein